MASVLLSSVGIGQQFFDNNGVPLAGGLIYTYQAGSSTPQATYTDNSGTTANSNPIVLDSSGRVPNEIWMLAGYSYKYVITSATGTSLISLDNLYPILQTSTVTGTVIPSGLIAIWSGSTGSIPSGWVLCNGANNTPDLRNSFIIGAGNTYAVGATGGSTTATLTQSNLPNINFNVTDPGHFHSYGGYGAFGSVGVSGSGQGLISGYSPPNTASANTGITVASGGSGTPVNTIPPYYALAFIMKT